MSGHDTVLLVDDDADVREIITLVLQLHGVPVATAADGVEALARLRASPDIGLVLLDLMMPLLDGEGVLREMKQDPSPTMTTPVVVMSGNRNVQATATRMGAAGCLLKPIELDDLLHIVGRFVPVTAEQTALSTRGRVE